MGNAGGGEVRFLTLWSVRLTRSLFSVISRKARAVYPCEAEHSSELSFEIGAIFEDGKCPVGALREVAFCPHRGSAAQSRQAVPGCGVVRSLLLWMGRASPRGSWELNTRACACPLLLYSWFFSKLFNSQGHFCPDVEKLVQCEIKKCF